MSQLEYNAQCPCSECTRVRLEGAQYELQRKWRTAVLELQDERDSARHLRARAEKHASHMQRIAFVALLCGGVSTLIMILMLLGFFAPMMSLH